jgi:hypothetical protein
MDMHMLPDTDILRGDADGLIVPHKPERWFIRFKRTKKG